MSFAHRPPPASGGADAAIAAQVGALCHRPGPAGPEIVLVTSRDTGRWVIPKGWPVDGRSAAEAAALEAWEEAGVRGAVAARPLGSYRYRKLLDGGRAQWCEVAVFPLAVAQTRDDFPERLERTRRWCAPAEAAGLVHEADLAALLEGFAPAAE